MLIGGISALLLQTLHPLAMAGVAEHSNYQRTRWGGCVARPSSSGPPPSAPRGGRSGHRPGAAGPPPGQGCGPRRPPLLGRRSRAGHLHPRGRGVQLPRPPARFGPHSALARAVRPVLRRGGAGGHRSRGRLGAPLGRTRWSSYFRRMRPEALRRAPGRARPGTGCAAAWPTDPSERAVYTLLLAAAISVLPRWARQRTRPVGAGLARLPVRHGGRHPAHDPRPPAAVRWVMPPPM